MDVGAIVDRFPMSGAFSQLAAGGRQRASRRDLTGVEMRGHFSRRLTVSVRSTRQVYADEPFGNDPSAARGPFL